MAYSLSTNLKLRLDSNLTGNAKYNLLKLDELGGVYTLDASGTVRIRSKMDMEFSANDASLGGLGENGIVRFGSSGNKLSSFSVHADSVLLGGGLSLLNSLGDPATARKLSLQYSSQNPEKDLSLLFDLTGQDRSLTLGGNVQIGGNLQVQVPGTASVTLPSSGVLATLEGEETLKNKTIDLRWNHVIGLTPAALDANFLLSGKSIDPSFGTQTVQSAGLRLAGPTFGTYLKAATSGQAGDLTFILPKDAGSPGRILATDGTGTLSWWNPAQTGFITDIDNSGFISLSVQNQKLSGDLNIAAAASIQDPAPQDEILIYNRLSAATRKASLADMFSAAQFSYATDWLAGNTFTIAHQLESLDIQVTCYDKASGASFIPETVKRLDKNTVLLETGISPPASGWRVVLMRSGFLSSSGAGTLAQASSSPLHAVSLTTSLPEFQVSGSSLSQEGTISLTLDSQEQEPGTFWAAPLGTSGKPGFRKLDPSDFNGVLGKSAHFTWTTSDGDQLRIQHNLGTRNIIVQLFDNLHYENVDGQTVSRVDLDTIIMTADTPPPPGGWTVLLQSVL